jgi:uncharacterized protein (TIGR00369 family)
MMRAERPEVKDGFVHGSITRADGCNVGGLTPFNCGMALDASGGSGADIARGWFESSPFIRLLGLTLESMGHDEAMIAMPYRPDLATAGDIVHGGAMGALLDTAAALAAWTGHDPAKGVTWGTIGITTSFLAPARGTAVRAHARVTRRGRSICYCRVEATDESGRPVAEALVTYRLGA